MSRRRREGPPPKIVLTCAACGSGDLIAEVYLDAEGDPVMTARAGSVEFSRVEPFELREGRLVHVRAEAERAHPRAATVHCPAGHPVQMLLGPLIQRLATMRPGERPRHAV